VPETPSRLGGKTNMVKQIKTGEETLRNTKIVATVSDRKCEVSFLRKLINAGANVIRCNTAHQQPLDTLRIILNVREVSEDIPVLIDTKGPEVRTLNIKEDIEVITGDIVCVRGVSIDDPAAPAEIVDKNVKNAPFESDVNHVFDVNYKNFVKDVPTGVSVLVDDGAIELSVRSKSEHCLICEVLNSGVIKNRKGINVPGVNLNLPALTEKDKEYLKLAADNDVDFIAHSFVRSAADIHEVRKYLGEEGAQVAIIAKIENQEGIDNFAEIVEAADGIMVARGDLGIELPPQCIPAIQKKIIKICIEEKKPVIVATQMLQSMMDSPRATRAEVSDVANAVYDGTDAIMLSGETAQGDYPVEAVETMALIANEVENTRENEFPVANENIHGETVMFLARTAIRAAGELPIKAILTDTTTGRTCRYLSSFRGNIPIYAKCYSHRIRRQVALSYGIHANYFERKALTPQFLRGAITEMLYNNTVKENDLIVVIAGNYGADHGASFIEIATPKRILEENAKPPGTVGN
jgi:pyruvate kinase